MTGPFHQGRQDGDYVRHGRQPGSVYLGGSKVRTDRPRVRSKSGKEARIPAYETLSSDKASGEKVMRAALAGVSTRNYESALGFRLFLSLPAQQGDICLNLLCLKSTF